MDFKQLCFWLLRRSAQTQFIALPLRWLMLIPLTKSISLTRFLQTSNTCNMIMSYQVWVAKAEKEIRMRKFFWRQLDHLRWIKVNSNSNHAISKVLRLPRRVTPSPKRMTTSATLIWWAQEESSLVKSCSVWLSQTQTMPLLRPVASELTQTARKLPRLSIILSSTTTTEVFSRTLQTLTPMHLRLKREEAVIYMILSLLKEASTLLTRWWWYLSNSQWHQLNKLTIPVSSMLSQLITLTCRTASCMTSDQPKRTSTICRQTRRTLLTVSTIRWTYHLTQLQGSLSTERSHC